MLTERETSCKCRSCVAGLDCAFAAVLGPRPDQLRGTPPDGTPDRGPSPAASLFVLREAGARAWAERGEDRSGGVGGEPDDQREAGEGGAQPPPGPGPGAPPCGERARSIGRSELATLMQRYALRQSNGRARQQGVSNTPLHNTSDSAKRGAVASEGEGREGFSPPAGGAGGTPRLRSVETPSAQNTSPPRPNEAEGAAGRLLAARLDWLTVAFRVELDGKLYERLELMRQHAMLCEGRRAPWEVWGIPFAVQGKLVREGEIALTNADAAILVSRRRRKDDKGNDAGPDWNVEVTLRAAYLATHSQADIAAYARSMATFFAERASDVRAERVRRADWAADAELTEAFATSDRPSFVGRMKRVTDYGRDTEKDGPEPMQVNTHWKPGEEEKLTGFSFAPGGEVMCRLYDKRAELERYEPEHEKRAIEHALWTRAGWSGGEVWRLEFQLRRPALEELKVNTIDQLFERVNMVWRYATEGWLRKIVPGSATRRERSRLDSRWLVYQSARFGAGEARIVRRERAKRGGPDRAQVVGTVQAYLASLGADVDPYDRSTVDPETGLFRLKPPEQLWRENLESLAKIVPGPHYSEAALAQRSRFASADDDVPAAEPERKAG